MHSKQTARFRQDLVVQKQHNQSSQQDSYVIKDKSSGETFEFGQEEFFLCQALDGKSSPELIIKKFQEQFGFSISGEDFESFFEQISDLGLVEYLNEQDLDSSVVPLENLPDYLINNPREVPQVEIKSKDKSKTKIQGVSFGNPEALFVFISSFLQPVSYLFRFSVWALIPLLVIASFTWGKNQFIIEQNASLTAQPSSFLFSLALHILLINFFSQTLRSIVASVYGIRVTDFGMRLRWGLIPVFYYQSQGINNLNSPQQIWIYGSILIFRLYIFVFGTWLWYANSGTSSILTIWGIIFANLGLLSFLNGAIPIRPNSPGAKLLCLCLGKPINYPKKLIKRTFKSIFSLIRNPTKAYFLSPQEVGVLLSGLVIAGVLCLVVTRIILRLATGLIEDIPALFGRSTFYVILTLLVLLFLNYWKGLLTKTTQRKKKKKQQINQVLDLESEENNHNAADFQVSINQNGVPILKQKTWWQKLFSLRNLLLFILVVVLFIPFPYTPGGEIQLLPPQQQKIQAPISGKIVKVFFPGGDGKFIAAGRVVAQMLSTEIQTEVLTLKEQIQRQQAEIEKKQANLNKLLSLPRKEEVNLAQLKIEVAREEAQISRRQIEVAQQEVITVQNQLQAAQITAEFSAKEVERLEILHNEGAFSLQRVEDARRQAATDRIAVLEITNNIAIKQKNVQTAQQSFIARQKDVQEAQANLQLVLSGAPAEDIEAARQEVAVVEAELRKLQQQLNHAEQQQQSTNLFMPFDGYLVDSYLNQKIGSYLNVGDTFAQVQDDSNLLVEIEIPEYDAGEIPVGATAQVKLVSYPQKPIVGNVVAIEPTSSEELYGIVFKVLVEVEDSGLNLRPGMSGYGKVYLGKKPLFALLSRPLARFLQIEFWSWLP